MKTSFKVALVGLPLLVIILLLLNYFNIFSLSLIFPKQLNWLPHQPLPEQIVQPSLSPPPVAPPPDLPPPPPFIRQ